MTEEMFGGQHRVAVNEIARAEDWAFVRRTPSRDATAAGAVTENVSLDTAEVVREVLPQNCRSKGRVRSQWAQPPTKNGVESGVS